MPQFTNDCIRCFGLLLCLFLFTRLCSQNIHQYPFSPHDKMNYFLFQLRSFYIDSNDISDVIDVLYIYSEDSFNIKSNFGRIQVLCEYNDIGYDIFSRPIVKNYKIIVDSTNLGEFRLETPYTSILAFYSLNTGLIDSFVEDVKGSFVMHKYVQYNYFSYTDLLKVDTVLVVSQDKFSGKRDIGCRVVFKYNDISDAIPIESCTYYYVNGSFYPLYRDRYILVKIENFRKRIWKIKKSNSINRIMEFNMTKKQKIYLNKIGFIV